jgi:DNA mismatch repair protein MSH5
VDFISCIILVFICFVLSPVISLLFLSVFSPRFSDGAGLFCGVLKHLLDRGSNCPKVLAATHFHDVFRADLLDPTLVPISFLHMQVMFTTNSGTVLDGGNSPDIGDGLSTPRNTLEHVSQDGEGGDRKVTPGEKITYLYR